MSKLCDQVFSVVKELFPQAKLRREVPVTFRGQKLFLDIFVPQFNLVIEVHGKQHDEFIEHFHVDAAGFKASKRRDALKEEWASEQGYIMIILRENQLPLTKDALLELIYERSSNG